MQRGVLFAPSRGKVWFLNMTSKMIKVAIAVVIAAAIAIVICFCIFSGDSNKDGGASETKTEYTGTGETLAKVPDVGTGTGDAAKPGLDWDELYKDMTPEEIAQFEQDLKDLGWTKEDIENLLYYDPETTAASADAPASETASAESEASETAAPSETVVTSAK